MSPLGDSGCFPTSPHVGYIFHPTSHVSAPSVSHVSAPNVSHISAPNVSHVYTHHSPSTFTSTPNTNNIPIRRSSEPESLLDTIMKPLPVFDIKIPPTSFKSSFSTTPGTAFNTPTGTTFNSPKSNVPIIISPSRNTMSDEDQPLPPPPEDPAPMHTDAPRIREI